GSFMFKNPSGNNPPFLMVNPFEEFKSPVTEKMFNKHVVDFIEKSMAKNPVNSKEVESGLKELKDLIKEAPGMDAMEYGNKADEIINEKISKNAPNDKKFQDMMVSQTHSLTSNYYDLKNHLEDN